MRKVMMIMIMVLVLLVSVNAYADLEIAFFDRRQQDREIEEWQRTSRPLPNISCSDAKAEIMKILAGYGIHKDNLISVTQEMCDAGMVSEKECEKLQESLRER